MRRLAALLLSFLAAACIDRPPPKTDPPSAAASPKAVATPMAFVHATIWTATGQRIENGTVVIEQGRFTSVGGPETLIPQGVKSIDLRGKIVTPGLIDAHSHVGVYPSPSIDATADGNEMTDPVTAQVNAENSLWPQDPNILRLLFGGTTTALILPGSGNLIGGRGVSVHMLPARTTRDMRIDNSPASLKMACGENPKRVYGQEKKTFPSTSMGNYSGYRTAFQQATEYRQKWDDYEKTKKGLPPAKDLKLETLSGVLAGKILVQNHCYRADEMAQMIELGDEFGFKIRTFHHALEAYKIRDLLAERSVAVATWADWWGFKLEAFDGIPQNAALLHEAGVRAIIHSDSALGAQRLNQEAAKALSYGRRVGIAVTEEDALRWITANPAWALGLEDQLGTVERGKLGDLVVWSGSPFSVYSKPELVVVEGHIRMDRSDPSRLPRTDFELGTGP